MRSAFIARQPIFNRRLEAVGCELLFRGHGWADDDRSESPQRATATVVLNSLTELELQRIVGRKQAWVDVPREFMTDGLAQAIPAGLSGLEISGAEDFDEELVEALRALRVQGYQLAIDARRRVLPARGHLGRRRVRVAVRERPARRADRLRPERSGRAAGYRPPDAVDGRAADRAGSRPRRDRTLLRRDRPSVRAHRLIDGPRLLSTGMPESPVVTDNPERRRYEISLEGERVGLLSYRVSGDVIAMLHAEIDPAHGGQGLGTVLAREALADARSRGLSVRPLCPFVAEVVRRDPAAYADLLAD